MDNNICNEFKIFDSKKMNSLVVTDIKKIKGLKNVKKISNGIKLEKNVIFNHEKKDIEQSGYQSNSKNIVVIKNINKNIFIENYSIIKSNSYIFRGNGDFFTESYLYNLSLKILSENMDNGNVLEINGKIEQENKMQIKEDDKFIGKQLYDEKSNMNNFFEFLKSNISNFNYSNSSKVKSEISNNDFYLDYLNNNVLKQFCSFSCNLENSEQIKNLIEKENYKDLNQIIFDSYLIDNWYVKRLGIGYKKLFYLMQLYHLKEEIIKDVSKSSENVEEILKNKFTSLSFNIDDVANNLIEQIEQKKLIK